MAKPIFTITDAAAGRIAELLTKSEKPALGLRVKTIKGGCAGLSYDIQYAYDANPTDEMVQATNGAKVYIDTGALMHLLGTEMDFIEETLSSRFVFHNPNQKTTCGCGESFNV